MHSSAFVRRTIAAHGDISLVQLSCERTRRLNQKRMPRINILVTIQKISPLEALGLRLPRRQFSLSGVGARRARQSSANGQTRFAG
jgi:hypothetical protein